MVDIEKIEKRTVQSFYDDGLFEIALGFVLLLLGGYFFAQTSVSRRAPPSAPLLSVLFVLVIVSAGFLVNRILRFLKRRITYPADRLRGLQEEGDQRQSAAPRPRSSAPSWARPSPPSTGSRLRSGRSSPP